MLHHKKIFIFFTLIALLFVPQAVMAKKYHVTCRSVIFSDSTRVKRLYGKGVHNRILPASTAKVMTALVVLERLSLDQYVRISPKATQASPSKIYARAGEEFLVRDLLYAMLLSSGNDAAIALAEAVAGSEWKFVQMMNTRAKQLGAKNTKFANASGLPSKRGTQYSTAYDIYLIFVRALKYSFFRDAIKLKYKSIASRDGRQIALKSHNKILFKDWNKKVYGKTGYTRAAGPCFVGTVQKGNSDLVIAAFNCSQRWDDIRYIVSRYGGISL